MKSSLVSSIVALLLTCPVALRAQAPATPAATPAKVLSKHVKPETPPGFTREGARLSGLRAAWIVNISNDAWFGTASGPAQGRGRRTRIAVVSRIAAGQMGFPDLYVFTHIAEPERRDRMITRELSLGLSLEAARRKTDRYALMVEPQRRFFDALSESFAGWVLAIETLSIERSVTAISGAFSGAPAIDGLEALDFIERWLAANAAA